MVITGAWEANMRLVSPVGLCSYLNLDKFEDKRRHYTTNYQNQPWKKTR